MISEVLSRRFCRLTPWLKRRYRCRPGMRLHASAERNGAAQPTATERGCIFLRVGHINLVMRPTLRKILGLCRKGERRQREPRKDGGISASISQALTLPVTGRGTARAEGGGSFPGPLSTGLLGVVYSR